jgi:hypothetical protein
MNHFFYILYLISFLAFSSTPEVKQAAMVKATGIELKANYSLDTNRIVKKAEEALAYNKKHKLNTSYCILIDMSIHSGRNRFFFGILNKIKSSYQH